MRAAGTDFPIKLPLRELTERALLQQVVAAGALVTNHGDILYLHGRTGLFLEPAPGEAGPSNILKMARDGLRQELTAALRQATLSKDTVCRPGLRVKTNAHFTTVNLTLRPVSPGAVAPPEALLYLVILEEAPLAAPAETAPAGTAPAETAPPDAEAGLAALRLALRAKEEYLQSANEELQSSTEELKSTNEEMHSVNEELQSTNEELETAKEEMQSVNEELATVNTELQTRVTDLSRVNDDMNNLLAGTGIGTVFVDHQLRILRFTPAVSSILNVIPGDLGRPVGHLTSTLVGYTGLVADVRAVLATLMPKEIEVQTLEGKFYTLRILPYRSQTNVIEGAVISFVDVTEMVRTREALHKANELLRLAVVVRDGRDAITVQDLDGRTLAWNPGATRLYGWSEAEAMALNVRDRIPPGLRAEEMARMLRLSQAEILEPLQTQRLTKQGGVVQVSIISTALMTEAGQMYAIATTERANEKAPGALT